MGLFQLHCTGVVFLNTEYIPWYGSRATPELEQLYTLSWASLVSIELKWDSYTQATFPDIALEQLQSLAYYDGIRVIRVAVRIPVVVVACFLVDEVVPRIIGAAPHCFVCSGLRHSLFFCLPWPPHFGYLRPSFSIVILFQWRSMKCIGICDAGLYASSRGS